MNKTLTEDDFLEAAILLGCDIAAVKAVCEVEAPKGGFLKSGEPTVLFEAHHFSRLTSHAYDDSHPNISSRTWNRSLYKGGQREHDRMARAVKLNRDAALQSASWGKFQIMGFNFEDCLFPRLQDFINAMYRSEGEHLKAFIGFVKTNNLDVALRKHKWATFARGYNGSGYAANKYDFKLAQAWKRHAG